MSLGKAYVDVYADVKNFDTDLATKLQASLAKASEAGTAGFESIAESAAVATAGIDKATAATARLSAEETKAATAAARAGATAALAGTGARGGTGAASAVAAQESIARASKAATDAQISDLARDVDSTVAAEKAKIAASNSAIAAINQEKAARRSQLADAIAAGDETVKALRAEIVEEGNLANAAVAAEKARIAASRLAIAAINEETLALKARNEAAGQTGPARAVSPIAALNNAAVRQELADMAAVAKAGQKAIEDAAKNAPQFSPGSASGIAQFQQVSDAAKKAAADQVKYNEEVLASARETARERAAAETKAYAQVAADAKVAAATARQSAVEQSAVNDALTKAKLAQTKADAATKSSARESARDAAAAYQAAYEKIAAAAEASGGTQRAEFVKTVTAAKAAAAEQIAASKNSLTDRAVSSLSDSIKGIPSDVFGAITTSAKYATVGVLGLGAALAGIGLVNAAKQQAAVVGFTALASEISGVIDATTGLSVATEGLSQAQAMVIGQNFENTLINLSNNSALAQTALQDTTQALLALGFNGDQAISTIRDIGNALAASGKTGGGLNDDLKGIVVAFSQIKGAGRLLAQDLNQITTRIPSAGRVQVYRELGIALKLAGAKAKEGTPEFNKFLVAVQKLAKEGKITSEVAIPAILKALREVPGAAKDAATGLDALGRTNLTLTGRFESLKDNIRSALAKAFLAPGEPGGPGGKSLSQSLADQIGTAIPAITASIREAGPALSGFVSSIGAALFKIIPPLVKLISAVFTQISNALDQIDLTGFLNGLSQIGVEGSGANTALSNFSSVLKGVGETLAAFAPVALGVGKGLAGIAGALVTLQHILGPLLGPFASLFKDIARSGLGQGLAAVTTILLASRIGVSLLAKALTAIAGWAYKATINMKAFGNASALAGNQAAVAAGKIEAGTLAGSGTAKEGFGASRFGKVLNSATARATIAIPLILTTIESVKALNATLDDAFNGTANGIAAAQKHANDIAPTFAILTQNIDQLNIPLSDLSKILDDVGLKTLADQFTTGQFTDTVSGLINALESQGLSAADVVTRLESLGIKTKDAQDAVKGFKTGLDAANIDLANLSTNQASAQFRALALEARLGALDLTGLQDHLKGTSDEALATISTIGRLGDILASLPTEKRIDVLVTIDTINNEIFKQTGSVPEGGAADAATISKNLQDQFPGVDLNDPHAFEKLGKKANASVSSAATSAGSAAQSAASKLADKIKSAKQTIIESLTAFRSDVTTQTAKQIRSTLTALRKQFDALGKLEGVKTGGLDRLLAKDSLALQKFSKDLAKATKTLDAAKARFTEVSDSIKSFASATNVDLESIGLAAKAGVDGVTKMADLSRLRIIKPGQDALNTITGGIAATTAKSAADSSAAFAKLLADRLAQITAFQANVNKLIKEGLNKTTIDQIISAGPEGGGPLAASLAGATTATINAINATQKGIDAAAKQLGNTAADSLFRSGSQVVAGLIQGLKDRRDEIKAAMKDIANALVAEIKKALKLHSPSRRMAEEVGVHIVPGILAPVHAAGGLVAKAMGKVADHLAGTRLATPGVDVSSLHDITAPRIAPIKLDTLGALAEAEANLNLRAALAPSQVQLLPPKPTTPQPVHLSDRQIGQLTGALVDARPQKEVHASIAQHFHGSAVRPADALGANIGRHLR